MIVQNAPNDALSDVLRLVDACALASVTLTAGGDWAIRFPAPDHIKFCALRRGSCWLAASDGLPPRHLDEGDCFVVVRGEFTLASSPDVRPVPAERVFGGFGQSGHCGDGDDTHLIGGSVCFDTVNGAILTDVLPASLVISGEAAAAVRWLLEQLDQEWRRAGPGSLLACNDMLRLMFIHALRAYVADLPPLAGNWLAGLADPRIGKPFEAIHADPVHDWTLAELASLAGQSRSAFASHFKESVGVSPMWYVARWRMRLAAARLRRSREPVSSIAASLGYVSDSAFSATFRRIMGVSPTRYRARFTHSSTGRASASPAGEDGQVLAFPDAITVEPPERRRLPRATRSG
ncbi:AraC family transcriptional regulator [Skermanella stibiiresistens SB22]|uniref:AraC family transcriptional regulator n=1 Tax=Skermanella stibiiresistens SB22 TaxID=1385369 RepID=W9H6N5_9PROT|nr:AraC family transcriptional regulator [Skermanella stibiiresistens]EWY41679.1 AraC family transcriptional regulator [Skermanella stibiiresistens SB22]